MEPFIIPLSLIAVIFFGINAFADYTASRHVYGRLLKRDELVNYFGKNLGRYTRRNSLSANIIQTEEGFEYLSKTRSLFSKYHIHDVGQIPRWSPFTKLLDRKFES